MIALRTTAYVLAATFGLAFVAAVLCSAVSR